MKIQRNTVVASFSLRLLVVAGSRRLQPAFFSLCSLMVRRLKPAATMLCLCVPLCLNSISFALSVKDEAYRTYLKGLIYEKTGELEKAVSEYERVLKLDPEATKVIESATEIALELGQYEQAIDMAKKLIESYPKDVKAHILLGKAYYGQGNVNKAEETLKKALEYEPGNKEAYILLIRQTYTYNPATAAEYCRRFLEIYPETPEVYIWISEIEQRAGNIEKAIKALMEVRRLISDHGDLPCKLGKLYELAGSTALAISEYEKCQSNHPDQAWILLKLGELNLKSGKDVQAITNFEEVLRQSPGDVTANISLALMAEQKELWMAAAKHMETVVKQNSNPQLMVRLAYYYNRAGNKKKAHDTLKELVALDNANPEHLYYYAVALDEYGQKAKAMRLLKEIVKRYPEYAEAHFRIGVTLDQNGDFKSALPHLRLAAKLDTENASSANYLGYTLADRNIELKLAENLISRALTLDPENPAYIDSMGWLRYRQDRFAEALTYLKIAAQKLNDPVILDHLGDTYIKLGEPANALTAWINAKTIAQGKLRRQITKKIKKLKKS